MPSTLSSRLTIYSAVLTVGAVWAVQAQGAQSLEAILGETRTLESVRDPKCEASAARIEDFIYGTPLEDRTRFLKHELQTGLVRALWKHAGEIAGKDNSKLITAAHINAASSDYLVARKDINGNWSVDSGDQKVQIAKRDFEHYSSVAYALRAILAVQQEQLLAPISEAFPELSNDAIARLKLNVDLYTLASLQLADEDARKKNVHEISADALSTAWTALGASSTTVAERPGSANSASNTVERIGYPTLRPVIEQKLASYEAYNSLNIPVFLRNLQVYFARHRWPKDPEEANAFKVLFTEMMIAFSKEFLMGAEKTARERNNLWIRPADVSDFSKEFLPWSDDEYEDITFFPNLGSGERIKIEAYDLDAFRDPGLHWMYLKHALDEVDPKGRIEPDPFASELIVENVAQFGVLLLRIAGQHSHAREARTLQPEDLRAAHGDIQGRVKAHAKTAPRDYRPQRIVSSEGRQNQSARFIDVTQTSGISFSHRSADWLARKIRAYTQTGPETGTLTIPPAFGGGGVAAEDLDGDGNTDILLLGGGGNRLFHNQGNGRFKDITTEAGLEWKRSADGHPGEPRQPIIADFNNDGLQDILITYVNDEHRVYKNLGNNKFEDVTDVANLGGKGVVGGPATVADFDRDGILDLYIGNFGNYLEGRLPTLARRNTNGDPNKLFKGLGDFRFEDVTEGSGTAGSGWTQATGHTDFDGDGLQDLIEGNDFGVNVYYRNLGNNKFEDVTSSLGTGKPSYTMNVGIADLNDDDLPDIYISNIVTLNKDEKYVLPDEKTTMKFNPQKLARMRIVEANDLFISKAAQSDKELLPSYENSKLVGRGYQSTGWSWDADFFDYDNDGDDDLYVVNGMNEYFVYSTENPYYRDPDGQAFSQIEFASPSSDANVLFANQGGRLINITEDSGLGLLGNSRSAAYFDFDNDGDLDVLVNNYHEASNLFENRSPSKAANWLSIRLHGDPKLNINRDAIGARIRATTPDGKRRWREVHGTTGYLSVHPKEVHFGTGKHDTVDIDVRWPNGRTETFGNLGVGTRYVLHYGEDPKPLSP